MAENPSNIDLLTNIRKNGRYAFDIMYREYWEVMYAAAYSKIKSHDLAQDIVQEIFIDFWNRKNTITISSPLKVYLLTAVRYKVIKQIQQEQKRDSLESIPKQMVRNDECLLEYEEASKLMEISLEKLDPSHQVIFRMNKLDGLNALEISQKVGLAPQSVRNILSKTTKHLRKELGGYLGIFQK